MNQRRVRTMAMFLLAALLIPAAGRNCSAQDPGSDPGGEAAKPDSALEAKKARARPRGRLPAYFSTVVSSEQREKVYSIQSRYLKQIDQLRRQIDELSKARDTEVDGVLTPEQLKRVNAKRAEAKIRRSKRTRGAAAATRG